MSEPSEQLLVLLLLIGAPTLGVVIMAALRLVYGARGPADGDDLHSALNITAWALLLIGAAAVTLASFGFGVVIVVALGAALLEYTLARRHAQRQTAWAILTQAVGRGHSVSELVTLQRNRFSGVVRNDLEGFAWQVGNGESLPTAIAIWRRAFPREAQGYAAIGKTGGSIPTRPAAPAQQPADARPGGADDLGYFVLVITIGLAVGGFVLWRIVPTFQQIFNDFDLELPRVTRTFLDCCNVLTGTPLAVLPALGIPLLAVALLAIYFLYLADVPALEWLTDRALYERRRAELLTLLAAAAEQGQPFTRSLQNLALGHPRFPVGCMGRPLRVALRAASSGADWKDALARAGLLKRHELPLLSASEKANNLPWALRALAERLVNRSLARWEFARGALICAGTLVLGLLVLWFCVAMFSPLVSLISSLC